ncbi:uncharacterized protein LOC126656945 [Mercurialis annua]|uniref:uncharacterized protein LOC126656945 n=1 Tax=Mercurialis annua TaxID=3986 RepID=UPI00215F8B31|nr:uncharacterized protein LOC126656945 [Mercurialis annua]
MVTVKNRYPLIRIKDLFDQLQVTFLGHMVLKDGMKVDPNKIECEAIFEKLKEILTTAPVLALPSVIEGFTAISVKLTHHFRIRTLGAMRFIFCFTIILKSGIIELIYDCLKRSNIHTLSDLLNKSQEDLKKIEHFCIDDVKHILSILEIEKLGYSSRGSNVPEPGSRPEASIGKNIALSGLKYWQAIWLFASYSHDMVKVGVPVALEQWFSCRFICCVFIRERELNVRQRRLLELLKDYDCTIQCHPGKANVVADALSRKSLGNLAHVFEVERRPIVREWQGSTKMYHDLKGTYWWIGIKKDVVEYVSKCLTCHKLKLEHQRPFGYLHPLPILEWKWERIAMNFVVGDRSKYFYVVLFFFEARESGNDALRTTQFLLNAMMFIYVYCNVNYHTVTECPSLYSNWNDHVSYMDNQWQASDPYSDMYDPGWHNPLSYGWDNNLENFNENLNFNSSYHPYQD